ncbi:MAG: MBL fold metallo-hydrolase [Clostridiales bacterium]|nr:MBL fold metallo-hydrolase [Clostridiales bacterium]
MKNSMRKSAAVLIVTALIATLLSSCTETTQYPLISDYEYCVVFLNIGYGDCTIIKAGGDYYMIDTASADHARDVTSFLAAEGITELAGLFLTHTDSDHTGGLFYVSDVVKIDCIYYPYYSEPDDKGQNQLEMKAESLGVEHSALSGGDTVETDNITFEILGPTEYYEYDDNDNSLVIRAEIDGIVYLFAGDMQFYEENLVLASGADVSCDVLKVGNHGNRDATSSEFLSAASPSVAVISANTTEKSTSASLRVTTLLSSVCDYYVTEDSEYCIITYKNESGEIIVEVD